MAILHWAQTRIDKECEDVCCCTYKGQLQTHKGWCISVKTLALVLVLRRSGFCRALQCLCLRWPWRERLCSPPLFIALTHTLCCVHRCALCTLTHTTHIHMNRTAICVCVCAYASGRAYECVCVCVFDRVCIDKYLCTRCMPLWVR